MMGDRIESDSAMRSSVPSVSVIIPTYARPIYLRDALSSIMQQDLSQTEYEVIVVDNKPTGEVERIIASLEESGPIRYLPETETGLHHARHAGARVARGEILVYVDDDVLMPEEWLYWMTRHFADPQVGCVGGKVVGAWEVDPPAWFDQFDEGHLSLLDLGDEPMELCLPTCVWGCNMAVRRTALFQVGGFNPDAFGDRRDIWMRGDGECGLQYRLYHAGYRVIYEPRAWLYHRISASRLAPQQLYRRLFDQGISDSYARVREIQHLPLMRLRLLKHSAHCFTTACRHYARTLGRAGDWVRARADAHYWYAMGQHQLRAALDKSLREHVLRESYL
ncbi:MAG TPA: glycosyltransferase family 2 protein [Chloroflexi bacterium]|nr:glycosyltransferase family 2 protein [Chloroflexota bacterium]